MKETDSLFREKRSSQTFLMFEVDGKQTIRRKNVGVLLDFVKQSQLLH